MQENTKNILVKLLPFSSPLNQVEKIIDKPWVIVDSFRSKKLIFRQNGQLLSISSGIVKVGKWEHIFPLNSLLLETATERLLLKAYFIDSAVMIFLKENGNVNKEYVILVNEDILPNLDYDNYLKSFGTKRNIRGITVGENFGGGIVFQVDANGTHGLIVGENDLKYKLQEPGMYNVIYSPWWAPYNNEIPLIDNHNDGLSNSNKIIAAVKNESEPYAAKSCREYRGGGFTDWYLPAISQLRSLYESNLIKAEYSDHQYWSSNSSAYDLAFSINFANGKRESHLYRSISFLRKPHWPHVRPIRSF